MSHGPTCYCNLIPVWQVHDPPGTSGSDLVDVVHCITIDFDGASATCNGYTIAIGEFNSASNACSAPDACIETPGAVFLDPVREVLTHRLVFRNIPECDGAQRLYASFTSDANGIANAKVRWVEFELNDVSGLFELRQEGTINPDLLYRWMPSITVDRYGNALLLYSVSSNSVSPSLRASSRLQDDPLGMMRGEIEIAAGMTWQDPTGPGANRWGDYFSVSVDPQEDYVFFSIGQYAGASGTWLVEVTRFVMRGNTIERTFFAEDACLSNDTCMHHITLGDGGA